MQIDKDKCTGCGSCVAYCAVHALTIENKKADCNVDLCTECNACFRSSACKFGALEPSELKWPRTIRSLLSDVFTEYCGVAGRGTEEMKTNDVTGRFQPGVVGLAIELGRPGVGTRFRDVQYMARVIAKLGGAFEPNNPVTHYLDTKTGDVNPDILDEFVISAIIEVGFPIERLDDVLKAVIDASKNIDTVFSLDVVSKLDKDGFNPAKEILDKAGYYYRPNCKTNVGLGKPSYLFS